MNDALHFWLKFRDIGGPEAVLGLLMVIVIKWPEHWWPFKRKRGK